jgi:prolyl-tRNA synthetase
MQDRKALQAGTSHFLGQNFSKAANIEFLDEAGDRTLAWTTSWGVSTRLIGGLVMTHADDDGMVMPPKLAPSHLVILPIYRKDSDNKAILDYCREIKAELESKTYHGRKVWVDIDDRDLRGGDKMWSWIKKGIPAWIEVGPRDVESDSVFFGRRDLGPKGRKNLARQEFIDDFLNILDDIQDNLLLRARQFRESNTVVIDSKDAFYEFFTPKNAEQPEIHGGFAMAHYSGEPELEAQLQTELKVTVRCIPLTDNPEPGICIFTGKPSKQRVVFAKAY